MVQWLRLRAFSAGSMGLIPLVRELSSHMTHGQKKLQKDHWGEDGAGGEGLTSQYNPNSDQEIFHEC